VFGVLFFLSLVVAGFSSSVSIIEAFVSAMVDKFNWNRKKLVTIISCLGFLGGIIFTAGGGLFWLDIVDHFLTQYGLVLVGFCECIIVGWFFKINILRKHINGVSTFQLGKWWNEMIRVFVPLVLTLILGGAFFSEINKPYGNYSWASLILIGVLWLIITVIAAIIIGSKQWRIDINNHKSRTDHIKY
jgi:NSS family neurotransmitter:Na+ symporter